MRRAFSIVLLLLVACRSSSPDPATTEDLLEPLCPPQPRSALPVPWSELPIPLPGGTLCANAKDLPEWKDGIEILHRGTVEDMVAFRDAYIAMFVAAGWTKVTRHESTTAGEHPLLHLWVHLYGADETKALLIHVVSYLDRVHILLDRVGWDDQRLNQQLEINRNVEEALERNRRIP